MAKSRIKRRKPIMWLLYPPYRETGMSGASWRPVMGFVFYTMFSFFQTIFTKVTSAIASVIIAVGLVSVPAISPALAPPIDVAVVTKEAQKDTKKETQKTETRQVARPATKPIVAQTPVAEVKPPTQLNLTLPPPTPPQTPKSTPTITTTTLPNGAVVEVDASGNIIRTIKEAPQPIDSPTVNTQQTQNQVFQLEQAQYQAQQQKTAQINAQIKQLLQQIIDIKAQYYKDISNVGGETIGFQQGEIDRLTNEANRKIDIINLQIQQLQLQY